MPVARKAATHAVRNMPYQCVLSTLQLFDFPGGFWWGNAEGKILAEI